MGQLPLRTFLSSLATAIAMLLLSAPGLAQGADDCASAQVIGGDGLWTLENGSATTDGVGHPLCDEFASDQIESDVWFAWTASLDGTATLSTCVGATFDTKIAAYDGALCGTSPILACDDDTCSLQSRISFPIVNGNTYLLRIGAYPGIAGGSGFIDLTQTAQPLTCVAPNPGPDVCVADLPDVLSWGSVGTLSGYSIATTACNYGDAELDWAASSGAHPVVAQNLYRYDGVAFEQLGMSWVSHTLTAANQSLCCPCINPATGSLLGVGCSDASAAATTGDQGGLGGIGGLGPRSDVDAFSGTFAFPYAAAGATGNAIYKRLQVETADLSPVTFPGASYFVEGHYVAQDDAQAGNHFNNASYREVLIGDYQPGLGAFDLNVTGQTSIGQPAIRAWAAQDPGVQISEVYLPNEGLFLVGSRATDNGDGTWHYEYAVYNHNSDRAGGHFSVPLPAGVLATNVSSRTVAHHSGEGIDVGPWTTSILSDKVIWATDDFVFNPNANALRWGSLFNYRFDADIAPVAGTVELGMFKGPLVRTVFGVVPDVPLAPPPPPNNDCSAAQSIFGLGSTSYDTTNATSSGFVGGGTCAPAIFQDVFFQWTALADGAYEFSTCGTMYDTQISIHFGAGDCTSVCLGSNDDWCNLQSRLAVSNVTAGDILLVQVGGYLDDFGPAQLNIGVAPTIPANDDCSSPTPAAGAATVGWNNLWATTSGFDGGNPGNCMSPINPDNTTFGQTHHDLFWAWTPTCNGSWRFSTEDSAGVKDTRISVHLGADCSATCLGSNDDIGGGNFLSHWTLNSASASETYLIQVGTWVGSSVNGGGILTIERLGADCVDLPITVLCDPASVHAGGIPAKLDTSGFSSATGTGLHIEATDGPPGQFGFVLLSGSNGPGLSVFNGTLCLGSPAARYTVQVATNQGVPALNSIGQFDAAGTLVNLAGTSSTGTGFDVPRELPFTPAGQVIQSGDVYSFQVWFRDSLVNPGDTANFTNLIEVPFP
tara:strand:+ start:9003 stop:11984 length:2982 start_codon:yes stop_codon:yes gene_type:complete